jgi:hypothetical protein
MDKLGFRFLAAGVVIDGCAHRQDCKLLSLIWRCGCQVGSSFDEVIGAGGALAGRHERKVQSVDCGVRLIYEGCHLKTRYSSRLAV